jgi:ubiquinone/menaquinone biosynthesis C-methylase UbiE
MKSSKDNPTYEKIGKGYNLTRRADPYLVDRLVTLLQANSNGSYLDLACGTGNYTVALADRGGIWTGIDHSSVMIQEASKKPSNVTWHIADAEETPFDSDSFDGAVITLSIHHFLDIIQVFQRLACVLKHGAPLVLFTSTSEQMEGYWLNHYFPEAMHKSITQMPKLSYILDCLRQGGFSVDKHELYFVSPELEDFFLYSGKDRPEIYLDEKVRRGSSTFANLASSNEVIKGCEKLSNDISSGHFKEIYNQYDNQNGDYIFIRALKL